MQQVCQLIEQPEYQLNFQGPLQSAPDGEELLSLLEENPGAVEEKARLLTPVEVEKVLDGLFLKSLGGASSLSLERFLEALTVEQLKEALKGKERRLLEAEELIPPLLQSLGTSSLMERDSFFKRDLEKASSIYKSFFPNLLDTFLKAFTFFDAGKEPESIWEANSLLDTYYKLFSIPFVLAIALASVVPVLHAIGLASLATSVGLGGLYVYLKWLKPCPDQLPGCINLTLKAQRGEIRPLVGRKRELRQLLAAISGETKQHVLIYGETGVGKTELARELARKIACNEVPSSLKKKKVYLINTGELVDSGWIGFTGKLKQLLMKVRGFEDRVIFFFDEIHAAMKSEALPEYLNTLLDEKKIQFIAAATTKGCREIAKDAAFQRRFPQKIQLSPPSRETMRGILLQIAQKASYSVPIDFEVIDYVIDKTEKMELPESQPARAINLLTAAINRVKYNFSVQRGLQEEVDEVELALKNSNRLLTFRVSPKEVKRSWALKKRLAELEGEQKKESERVGRLLKIWKSHRSCVQELVNTARNYRCAVFQREKHEKKLLALFYHRLPSLNKEFRKVKSKLPEKLSWEVDVKAIDFALEEMERNRLS